MGALSQQTITQNQEGISTVQEGCSVTTKHQIKRGRSVLSQLWDTTRKKPCSETGCSALSPTKRGGEWGQWGKKNALSQPAMGQNLQGRSRMLSRLVGQRRKWEEWCRHNGQTLGQTTFKDTVGQGLSGAMLDGLGLFISVHLPEIVCQLKFNPVKSIPSHGPVFLSFLVILFFFSPSHNGYTLLSLSLSTPHPLPPPARLASTGVSNISCLPVSTVSAPHSDQWCGVKVSEKRGGRGTEES